MTENQKRTFTGRNSVTAALKNIFNVKLLPANSGIGFKLLNGINREVVPHHVTKMSQSMTMYGIIRPVVVADLNFGCLYGKYILDGTHLYHACMRNNQDIPYIEVTVTNEQELIECLAMLNNSSKPWRLTDYVQSWSYIYDDYKRLLTYHNIYDLELTSVAGILSSSNNIFSSISVIKDGTFRIKNEEQAIIILDMVSDLIALFPKYERVQFKNLVNGFVHFVKSNFNDYDHKSFMTQIKGEIPSLHIAAASTETAVEYFSNLYTL